MLKLGRVEKLLRSKVDAGERLVFVLVDPEKPVNTSVVANLVERGADAVLVGGTLNVTPYDVDEYIRGLRAKGVNAPIIIFPGGVNNIGREADAILFMSLLNSVDPYWLMGAQITAAPIIKRIGLETIPTAYIIYGHGGAAGHIGRSLPIPWETPYITAAYALAAEMMGMRLIYLEAGSGSPSAIPEKAVEYTRAVIEIPLLIVGGGIREPEKALNLVKAGAHGIVIGTVVEKKPEKAATIIEAVKKT